MASISQTCHCGLLLKKSTVVECFGPGFTVTCDGCGESVGGSDDIYKCPKGDSATHSGGSEFCLKCAKAQKVECESDLKPAVESMEDAKEEISGSADSRPSAKPKRRRQKSGDFRKRDDYRKSGKQGTGEREHGCRRYGDDRDEGYERRGGRRGERDGRGRGFHGGFQRGRGRHQPEVHVHHYYESPPTGHFPRDGRFRGPPPFQQPRGEHFDGGYYRVPHGHSHGGGHSHGCGPHCDGHYEPGHGGYSRGRGERGHGRDRGRGKERVRHATRRKSPKKTPESRTRLCNTCNVQVEKTKWSEHSFSQPHFDKMSAEEKAKPMFDKTCRYCEAVTYNTMGEYLLHCMSDSHKTELAAKKTRRKRRKWMDIFSQADFDAMSAEEKAKPVHDKKCICCEAVTYDTMGEYVIHCMLESHKLNAKKRLCKICNVRVETKEWSEHRSSQAHFDKMSDEEKAKPFSTQQCHCCEAVTCKTMGEWVIHCMLDSHKKEAAAKRDTAKKERESALRISDASLASGDLDSAMDGTTVSRVCFICAIKCPTESDWKTHIRSEMHLKQKRVMKYCDSCKTVMKATEWPKHRLSRAHVDCKHIQAQEHYDKMPETKRAKVVNKECSVCDVFCTTQGEWALHHISAAHIAATAKLKSAKKPTILTPTKFPHTCKLCVVFCSTPSKWRTHESSQKHSRSVELKRHCVSCDRVMLRSEFEAHEFSQAHLEQMDDESKNEVVNRWCVYCDDVLCRTQERWILHCMSPEHRCAEAATKGEDLSDDESDSKSATDETEVTVTTQFVEFCNLQKDEMATWILVKVISLLDEYKGKGPEEITGELMAAMSPKELFEFVNADETEAKRKIVSVIHSKKPVADARLSAAEPVAVSDTTDVAKMTEVLKFCSLTKDDISTQVIVRILSSVGEPKEMSAELIVNAMQATMSPTQLFEFVNADDTEVKRVVIAIIQEFR